MKPRPAHLDTNSAPGSTNTVRNRPLRRTDFLFATLGAAVFAGGAFLLCLWIEDALLQRETPMGRVGVAVLMIGPKFILPIFVGAVGIAFGCALAQKLFPQEKGDSSDASSK